MKCEHRDAVFAPDALLAALPYPTPYYIYDEAGIRARAKALHEAFAWNSGFRQWFPLRANPNPTILRILRQEGFGIVCTNANELEFGLRCGFSAEEINFSPAFPTAAEFLAARHAKHLILDDADLIMRFERNESLPPRIALRYRPHTLRAHPAARGSDSRFGMEKPALLRAVRELRLLGVREIGLMAELAENSTQPEYLPKVAGALFQLAAEIKETLGVSVKCCNLGGGVGIAGQDDTVAILQLSRSVRKLFEQHMLPAGLGDCAVHTQFDRHILSQSGLLLTTVTGVKSGAEEWLGVDMTRADLLRALIYGTSLHISVLGNHADEGRRPYRIADRIAENKEMFGVRLLPPCKRGSVLVVHDVGAYGHAMGYQYCMMPRCAEYLLQADGASSCIRLAQTLNDL
ncbi:MAG: diaminopimelate decarboxylase [Oscillospiraceae bacterium]|nr:diaminopimelate decarboxylase [Oscillospiraceae bacterium]